MRYFMLVALFVVAACSETVNPVVPPAFEGTYVAQTANGQPLPALLHEEPYLETGQVIRIYVLADTLTIEAGGLYRQRAQLESRLDGQLIGHLIWSDHGRFVRDGERTTFESEYLENVAFTADRAASGTLQVTQDLTSESTPVVHVFTRLDQP